MFGIEKIIDLLIEIKVTNHLLYDEVILYRSEQQRWRAEDEQRRQDEDSIMKRYLDLMQEANQQAAQPIDKQAIYNEMERERKARARDRKAKEEEMTNG